MSVLSLLLIVSFVFRNGSINLCVDLLFSKYSLPVDKETFIKLAKFASCKMLMLTHDGYYIQTEGLAMGSPPAPHLANGWMSQFDPVIKGDAKLYFRYLGDIMKDSKITNMDQKLQDVNRLHETLTFSRGREKDGSFPMLEMRLFILNEKGSLWYRV